MSDPTSLSSKQEAHIAARLAAIVESSEDAIISKDLNGTILTWNQSAERIYGYTAAEAIGQSMSFLLPPNRETEETDILNRLRQGGLVSHFDTTRVRKDGKSITVSLTISPVKDTDGTIIGASHVARDITDRKRFEEQLRQSQRLESLGILAGGIAHDFNNLLTGVLGNASIAAELLPDGSTAQSMLREITTAAQCLADLTRQLLAYAGKGALATASVNLTNLVREIAALVQSSIPKNVHVRLQLDELLPDVHADPSQLQQIIMNLIINGAEAIPPNEVGTVIVTTTSQAVDENYILTILSPCDVKPGQYVCLEVHDTGKGMDTETQARIFDPFFTTKIKGRGLGLAAVLGIVGSHQGAIKVYSQPGKGSTFKVLLPAQAQPVGIKQSASARESLRGEGTILVIDDEEVIRKVAKTSLEQLYGYTVLLAQNGEQGIELCRLHSNQIRAVVLDLMMPGLSGEETYRQLRLTHPNLPVILSSGYSDSEAMLRFSGKDLAGFLKKPYTAAEIGGVIKKTLTEHMNK
jgi:PAS domain S-box-containing protein